VVGDVGILKAGGLRVSCDLAPGLSDSQATHLSAQSLLLIRQTLQVQSAGSLLNVDDGVS
jgi:hypothetical protein